MAQHIHLVWVCDTGSKPLQRGSWWVSCVPQVRLDLWEGCSGDDPRLGTAASQRGTWCLGFSGEDYPLPARPCSTPTCSHDDPSIAQLKKNTCFADQLLLLTYSGFVFPFRILFSGHTAERWALGQPNRSLLRSHPAIQNTRFVPPRQLWLPGGFAQFLAAGTCHPRHQHWPCRLHHHHLPLCVFRVLLYILLCEEQILPAVLSAWVEWRSHQRGSDQLQAWALVALLRMKVKRSRVRCLRCCTGQQLALQGRELPKNTSTVQCCSYSTVHRTLSGHLDAMQAGTLRGLRQPMTVVTLACCLGSGHSKRNCRLHLPGSSLYHQFYCIAQNQFLHSN